MTTLDNSKLKRILTMAVYPEAGTSKAIFEMPIMQAIWKAAQAEQREEDEPVAQVIGEPISDPCGDQQVWLVQVHSHLPLTEGTKLFAKDQS